MRWNQAAPCTHEGDARSLSQPLYLHIALDESRQLVQHSQFQNQDHKQWSASLSLELADRRSECLLSTTGSPSNAAYVSPIWILSRDTSSAKLEVVESGVVCIVVVVVIAFETDICYLTFTSQRQYYSRQWSYLCQVCACSHQSSVSFYFVFSLVLALRGILRSGSTLNHWRHSVGFELYKLFRFA